MKKMSKKFSTAYYHDEDLCSDEMLGSCECAVIWHSKDMVKRASMKMKEEGDQTKLSELVQYCSQASKMRYRKYK